MFSLSILKKKRKAIRNKFPSSMSRVCVHFHAFMEKVKTNQLGLSPDFTKNYKYKKVQMRLERGSNGLLTMDEMI